MKNKIVILLIFLVPFTVFFLLQKTLGDNSSYAASDIIGPKLVKFYSPMCTECSKVGKNIENAIKDYENTIFYEEINVAKNDRKTKNSISSYGVTVVPTLLFIDKDGKVCEKVEGMIDEETIKENLDVIKQ